MPLLAEDALCYGSKWPKDTPKKRGRPTGSKDSQPRQRVNKEGTLRTPQVGSRPWLLTNLLPGKAILFENVAGGPVGRLMQQIQTDIVRNGLTGKMAQMHLIAINPKTRTVFDIVRVERIAE